MPVEVVETSRFHGLRGEDVVCIACLQSQGRGVLATSGGKVLVFNWEDGVVVRQLRGVFANTTQILSVETSPLIAIIFGGQCSIFDSRNGDLVYQFKTKSARQVQYQICSPTCIVFILASKDKIRTASIQDAHCFSLVSTRIIQLPFVLSQFCVSDEHNETVVCHDEYNQALYLVNYFAESIVKIRECLFPKPSFFSRSTQESVRTITSFREHYAALTGCRLILGKKGTQFHGLKLRQAPIAAYPDGPIFYILFDSHIEARDVFSGEPLIKSSMPPKTRGMANSFLWNDDKVFKIETTISDAEFSKIISESTAKALMIASSGAAATESTLVQEFVKNQVVLLLDSDELASALNILEVTTVPVQAWAKSLWDYLKRYREAQASESQADDTISLMSSDLAPGLRGSFQRLEKFLLSLRDLPTPEQDKNKSSELVDTSLFASYLTRNSPSLKAFLRLPNKCKEEEVQCLLRQYNHLDLLAVFFSSRGLYQKALILIHELNGIEGVKSYLPTCQMSSLKQALEDYREELTAADIRQILESASQQGPDELINESIQVLLKFEPGEAGLFCQAMKDKFSSPVVFWCSLANIALETDNVQLLQRCFDNCKDKGMTDVANIASKSSNAAIKLLGLAYLGKFKELLKFTPHLSLENAIDYVHTSSQPLSSDGTSMLNQLMQSELASDFDGALKLLCDNSDLFDLERFLDFCNDDIELERILSFITAKLRSSVISSARAQGNAALTTVAKRQLKQSVIAHSKANWLINEQSFCSRCHRSLGLGKLSIYPDGTMAHFGCSQ